ncbi:MAG: TonB-dependent receptor [Erythrobacter sp.]
MIPLSAKLAAAGTVSAIAMVAFPGVAYAQQAEDADDIQAEDDGAQLDTIIVTAQRREESVQNVPIAISAFDDRELERRGVSEALQIAQFVPNLVGLNNTGLGSANAYFLRGLGNTETIPTFDPPIGTYVDDIYLSRQNANNLSFFDVERVEILRGPQGTLFGRNTTGGAVNVFLADPDLDVGGYAEVGYGSYDTILGRASVDLPLADTFAVKVSGYFQDDEGYALNSTTGERVNENDGWGVRLGLLGELSDTARWTGSYMHTESQAGNILNFDCDPANPDDCDGRFVTTGLTADTNFGNLLTGEKADYGLGNDTTMDFISSNLELELAENLSVNIITGYVYTTQDYALDFADGRGLPSISVPVPSIQGYTFGGFTIVNEGEFSQFSQEIKFNASLGDGFLDLVGGLFYFEEDNFSDFGDVFTLPLAPPPTGLPIVLADRTLRNETEAYAGYLQGDLNLTDALTLTAGIRYTDETKNFSVRDNRASCRVTPLPANCLSDANLTAANGVPIPQEQTVDIWTPRFAVAYEPDDNLLFFASATRGFKSGGWNARGTNPAELLPFGPETAWSYEAGFKTELLDRRLRVNLTAFWLDVESLQTPSAFTRENGSIAFITRNFANYQNRGIELELNAVPTDGLNLFAAFGYQDDEYQFEEDGPEFDEFGVESVLSQQARCLDQLAAGLVPGGGAAEATACGVGIVAPDGSISTPVRTPDFTLAVGGSYRAELGGGLSLTPSLNASWRDESETGTSNLTLYDVPITSSTGAVFPSNPFQDGEFVTGSFSEARWIVNATLRLAHDDGWSLLAECTNCLDEEAIESTLANFSYLNPPRRVMVRARFDF